MIYFCKGLEKNIKHGKFISYEKVRYKDSDFEEWFIFSSFFLSVLEMDIEHDRFASRWTRRNLENSLIIFAGDECIQLLFFYISAPLTLRNNLKSTSSRFFERDPNTMLFEQQVNLEENWRTSLILFAGECWDNSLNYETNCKAVIIMNMDLINLWIIIGIFIIILIF